MKWFLALCLLALVQDQIMARVPTEDVIEVKEEAVVARTTIEDTVTKKVEVDKEVVKEKVTYWPQRRTKFPFRGRPRMNGIGLRGIRA